MSAFSGGSSRSEALAPSSLDTFELGCNWWPRRSAMYMWRDLELGEIRDELAHLRALGFDVVRLFTLTADFLPAPGVVAADKVDALVRVVTAAKDAGLRVVPTLVVINMSGRAWWPGWMLDARGASRGLYTDPDLLASQELLASTCARALAGDSAIRAIDLANEIDDAEMPPTREAVGPRGARRAGPDRDPPPLGLAREQHARRRPRPCR